MLAPVIFTAPLPVWRTLMSPLPVTLPLRPNVPETPVTRRRLLLFSVTNPEKLGFPAVFGFVIVSKPVLLVAVVIGFAIVTELPRISVALAESFAVPKVIVLVL